MTYVDDTVVDWVFFPLFCLYKRRFQLKTRCRDVSKKSKFNKLLTNLMFTPINITSKLVLEHIFIMHKVASNCQAFVSVLRNHGIQKHSSKWPAMHKSGVQL